MEAQNSNDSRFTVPEQRSGDFYGLVSPYEFDIDAIDESVFDFMGFDTRFEASFLRKNRRIHQIHGMGCKKSRQKSFEDCDFDDFGVPLWYVSAATDLDLLHFAPGHLLGEAAELLRKLQIRLNLGIGSRSHGHGVDGRQNRFTLQRMNDLFGDLTSHFFLGLIGRGRDVRRGNDAGMVYEFGESFRWRLGRVHIQCCAAHLPGFESPE